MAAGLAGALIPALDRVARALGTCWLLFACCSAGAAEIWVDIDTTARRLTVMEDEHVVAAFDNISVGRGGVTADKSARDGKTPLGSYRVRRINTESRFHIYFGFDYPNLKQAQRAFQTRRITYDQLKAIRKAHYLGAEPPFDTALGGFIGIHGIGAGDLRIHEDFNWTEGCVAVTNEQVEELARWLKVGSRVEVH